MKIEWYDYDKWEMISLPPAGVECEWCSHNDGFYTKATILADIGNDDFVIYAEGRKRIVKNPANFRPLDYDKNKQKVVNLDWLVRSGIDCEFMDGGDRWLIDKLFEITVDNQFASTSLSWGKCRPRMNHEHVLNHWQIELIPDCFLFRKFDVNCENHAIGYGESCIVEFTGLKDGYIYPYEIIKA